MLSGALLFGQVSDKSNKSKSHWDCFLGQITTVYILRVKRTQFLDNLFRGRFSCLLILHSLVLVSQVAFARCAQLSLPRTIGLGVVIWPDHQGTYCSPRTILCCTTSNNRLPSGHSTKLVAEGTIRVPPAAVVSSTPLMNFPRAGMIALVAGCSDQRARCSCLFSICF